MRENDDITRSKGNQINARHTGKARTLNNDMIGNNSSRLRKQDLRELIRLRNIDAPRRCRIDEEEKRTA